MKPNTNGISVDSVSLNDCVSTFCPHKPRDNTFFSYSELFIFENC